jgi:gliding motility-associated lipoprotein GldK
MKQKYILLAFLSVIILNSCSNKGDHGELGSGVYGNGRSAFNTSFVEGMVYVPGGSFLLGQADQDITFSHVAQTKQVTIAPFFMDQTEITNSQYKKFVNWVVDSIAITGYLNDPKYFYESAKGAPTSNGKKFINWDYVAKNPIFAPKKGSVANPSAQKLQGMYYQGDDKIFDQNELDVRLLKYTYAAMVLREAATFKNNKTKKRSDFIFRDTVPVYPDTLVWLSDFSYAANEPLVEGYFSHPAYRNYPVVGVTWRQAKAFNSWRTRYNNNYAQKKHLARRFPYDLPTEAEFEYAARGGKIGTDYPWGGPYIRNSKGCLLANFKPSRGNYIEDGGAYTVNVKSYFPNDYGLYNMAGNVAEWTSSAYDESSTTFISDIEPTYHYSAKQSDPEVFKRKVVRGGSWKDVGYFLQNATRSYEFQDTAKSYIGFRCVTRFVGRELGSAE